jgi:hypothetical protein
MRSWTPFSAWQLSWHVSSPSFQFFSDVVYRKAFGSESLQDISGDQREWLDCCQTGQSAFCWHHVFPCVTHRLQFLLDLDVNAIDDRIYSVFRGLLQDGFLTLQIFLLDVSAYWNRFKDECGRSDMYMLNNIGAKTLPCGKPLFYRRNLLLWFPRNTWKKWFDSLIVEWIRHFRTGDGPQCWKPASMCVVSAIMFSFSYFFFSWIQYFL